MYCVVAASCADCALQRPRVARPLPPSPLHKSFDLVLCVARGLLHRPPARHPHARARAALSSFGRKGGACGRAAPERPPPQRPGARRGPGAAALAPPVVCTLLVSPAPRGRRPARRGAPGARLIPARAPATRRAAIAPRAAPPGGGARPLCSSGRAAAGALAARLPAWRRRPGWGALHP